MLKDRFLTFLLIFFVSTLSLHAAGETLTIDVANPGINISPTLYGVFFEEINHAGDGGLYAELIRNRSFDDSTVPIYWTLVGSGSAIGSLAIEKSDLLNSAQTNALRLNISRLDTGERVGVSNSGYWGIGIRPATAYAVSFFAKAGDNFTGTLDISLEGPEGTGIVYASTKVSGVETTWKQFQTSLSVEEGIETTDSVRLVISSTSTGTVWLDVVSLTPPTWNGRTNGMRIDLAEMVKNLNPKFFRFPGGCVVEGDSLANAFQWKQTIGDISERRGHWNLWGYQTTGGLGFHEYLQLCEDLGAEPLYVINCGISHSDIVPLAELDPWIQDALDAIEYANGPTTSFWGAKRAANGHPEPFNIKYVEIGNENNFQYERYKERYPLFYSAIKNKYPEIITIANGLIPNEKIEVVDEHYYMSPGWFIANAGRYDNADRNGPKIYVGEYAATSECGTGNFRAALGEAAFMTGLERNSDIVIAASYAPLFVNSNDRKWNPDAIVFDSVKAYGTPSYYVQQMFGQNMGEQILPSHYTSDSNSITGAIGLGTWNTQSNFDDVLVTGRNSTTLLSDNFSDPSQWNVYSGDWEIKSGTYNQTKNETDCRSTLGDSEWSDYTFTVKARKQAGAEGFLIMFGVKDSDNYFWWNIGGWGNTKHAIEKSVDGQKSTLVSVPGSINTNQWYDIKIELQGLRIRTYLNNVLIHDIEDKSWEPIQYVSSLIPSTGEIILKVVNTSNSNQDTTIVLDGADKVESGKEILLTSVGLDDENSFSAPNRITPIYRSLAALESTFTHQFPARSVSVIRLATSKAEPDVNPDTQPDPPSDGDTPETGSSDVAPNPSSGCSCRSTGENKIGGQLLIMLVAAVFLLRLIVKKPQKK